MKRNKILEHIHKHRCFLLREGKKHSVYPHTFHVITPSKMERAKRNSMKGVGVYRNQENDKISTIPRHREIDDFLVDKICKDLGIPKIK